MASFTAPSTKTGTSFADITFTPTTTVTLDSNTDYWVVAGGGNSRWVWSVTGPAEDDTPAPGWSIADRGQSYNPNSGSWDDNGGDLAWQIAVIGTIIDGGGDTTPPSLDRATVNGSALALTYNETLDGASTPAPGDFVVTAAGSTVGVSGVSVSGSAVTLTLATAVEANQTVTLNYTPGANPIQGHCREPRGGPLRTGRNQ